MKKTKEQGASNTIADSLYTKFHDIFPSRGDWDITNQHQYWTYSWDNKVHRVGVGLSRVTKMTSRLTAFGRSPDVYKDVIVDTGMDIYRPGYVLDNTGLAPQNIGDTIFYAGLRTYIECTFAPSWAANSIAENLTYRQYSTDSYAVTRVQLLMPGTKPQHGKLWKLEDFLDSYEVTESIATFLREQKLRMDELYLDVSHGQDDLAGPKHQAEELIFYVTADLDSLKKGVEKSESGVRAKK